MGVKRQINGGFSDFICTVETNNHNFIMYSRFVLGKISPNGIERLKAGAYKRY
jgi:hypothetical protein